jgi:hypothetical protein
VKKVVKTAVEKVEQMAALTDTATVVKSAVSSVDRKVWKRAVSKVAH